MLATRLTSRRLGRFAVAAFAAAVTGVLGFTSTQLLGATVGNASVFAALVTVIVFFWGITVLNLRFLGYFPRQSERFIDRAARPAIAVLFGVFGVLSAPGLLVKVLVVVTVTALVLHLGRTSTSTADLLGDGAIYPRSTADARTMLELLRQKQRRRLSQRGMFFTRLNTALALITLAESENTYRHLHDAYEILHGLAASASTVDHVTRLAIADALVDTTSRLYQFGDSLEPYEQAVDLLDRELRNSDLPYVEFRRLLTLADLKFWQSCLSSGRPAADVTSRTSTLREAVEHLRDARPLAPRHRRADLHLRLVLCHGMLADLLADPSCRSEAVAHARLALRTITFSSREERPFIELSLAVLLLVEFGETGSPSLADEAERLADGIRSSRNQDARAWGLQIRIWARQLRDQAGFPEQGPGLDLTAAAMEVTSLQPCSRIRLQVAATLADWAAHRNQATSAAWGYREALATARNISATGLVRKQQQAPLYEVGGFAAEAAHWLLESGRPHEAVEAIEAGRALVLSSAVHRDMLVRRLDSFDPRLAHRCAELSALLARVDGHASATPGSGQLWAVVSERRAARAAHEEWLRLSGWLRRWPEFRALLDPPSYSHVSAAAEYQPLVYLIAARRTGYALIVMPRSRHPDVLRLPGLTSERVAEVAEEFRSEAGRLAEPLRGRTHWQSALAGYLDWLREHAMQPLAGSLRSPGPVALIPVGDLALLPLHAACEIGGPAAVTYSYAPSAPVIAHATEAVRARGLAAPANALVVASAGPQDQQLRYLDYAARALKSHVREVTALSGASATREAGLAALGSNEIYHFACHGAADGSDPLESHLQVVDGRLTVRDVLNQRLRGRLAVLAACETAVPYAQLPDESIGLPAALLEAGVPGIVATQWPVEEIPTMLLTTRFYEQWLRLGQNPAVALQQAQHWLRTRTYGQLETYVRKHLDGAVEWPYRHTGNARQHLMFAHPDHWAAFSYTGV